MGGLSKRPQTKTKTTHPACYVVVRFGCATAKAPNPHLRTPVILVSTTRALKCSVSAGVFHGTEGRKQTSPLDVPLSSWKLWNSKEWKHLPLTMTTVSPPAVAPPLGSARALTGTKNRPFRDALAAQGVPLLALLSAAMHCDDDSVQASSAACLGALEAAPGKAVAPGTVEIMHRAMQQPKTAAAALERITPVVTADGTRRLQKALAQQGGIGVALSAAASHLLDPSVQSGAKSLLAALAGAASEDGALATALQTTTGGEAGAAAVTLSQLAAAMASDGSNALRDALAAQGAIVIVVHTAQSFVDGAAAQTAAGACLAALAAAAAAKGAMAGMADVIVVTTVAAPRVQQHMLQLLAGLATADRVAALALAQQGAIGATLAAVAAHGASNEAVRASAAACMEALLPVSGGAGAMAGVEDAIDAAMAKPDGGVPMWRHLAAVAASEHGGVFRNALAPLGVFGKALTAAVRLADDAEMQLAAAA